MTMLKAFIGIFLISLAGYLSAKTIKIQIITVLCDNKYQGIVPVPKGIGNGQEAKNNLYWGAGYGVKTYFTKSKDWKKITFTSVKENFILDDFLIQHNLIDSVFLYASAYDGRNMKEGIEDLFLFAAGKKYLNLKVNNLNIQFGSGADLIIFVGHNGLMDFSINQIPEKIDKKQRALAVFACYSKSYFYDLIKSQNNIPLILTNGLMCPEAYTSFALINSFMKNESHPQIKKAVADAYNKYQKCGAKAAMNLFFTE